MSEIETVKNELICSGPDPDAERKAADEKKRIAKEMQDLARQIPIRHRRSFLDAVYLFRKIDVQEAKERIATFADAVIEQAQDDARAAEERIRARTRSDAKRLEEAEAAYRAKAASLLADVRLEEARIRARAEEALDIAQKRADAIVSDAEKAAGAYDALAMLDSVLERAGYPKKGACGIRVEVPSTVLCHCCKLVAAVMGKNPVDGWNIGNGASTPADRPSGR